MKFIVPLLILPALAVVFIVSDDSWSAFSEDFPSVTNATAGPYILVVSALLYSYSLTTLLKKLNSKPANTNNDPLSLAGLQISLLCIIILSFVYSFNPVNTLVSIRYFLLGVLILVTFFFGILYFVSAVKKLDGESSETDHIFFNKLLETKRILHDAIVQTQDSDERIFLQAKVTYLSDVQHRRDRESFSALLNEIVGWLAGRAEFRDSYVRLKIILEGVESR